MPALRRLAALVTMLVTLLLVLTESGYACSGASMAGMAGMGATSRSGAGAPTAAASADPMASMPGMPGMPAAHQSETQTGPQGAPDQGPCRFPWAPDGCRDMAPCAPAALAVATATPLPPAHTPEARLTLRVAAPASLDTPPEPPPPRA